MARTRRPSVSTEASLSNRQQLARLGVELRESRRRRGWTQRDLAQRAGVSHSTVWRIETGRGAGVTLDSVQRTGVALGRAFQWSLATDILREPPDAGHLAVQELLLRLGRATGYHGSFELALKSADPSHSIDVRLRSDSHRRLLVEEAWNTLGDIGAGKRSFDRKLAATDALAIAVGHGRPYAVHGCWVVRANARNGELVARYPEVFASGFPGTSEGWVRALMTGTAPPVLPGLVWCDVKATHLFAWRRRNSR